MQEALKTNLTPSLTSKRRSSTKLSIGSLPLAFALCLVSAASLGAQSAPVTRRPVRHLVTPVYPELAKKMNLTGAARIEVTIAPDGTVKRTRVLGGHPVLAAEAEHAASKSTFEPSSAETVEVIEFRF
jgi:TonB family protein